MAEKKAIIVLAGAAAVRAGSESLEKAIKKGAFFPNYNAGDIVAGAVEEAQIQKMAPEAVAEGVEKGVALMLVDLSQAGNDDLEKAMAQILDAADRRTVIAIAAKDGLLFHGSGINSKAGNLDRQAEAKDVLPTLAAIGEFPLTTQCMGAVLYQALKSANPKLDEVYKLRDGIQRMEGALARDNREPWDKHDCA